jgi:hypothetical protein
MTFTAPYIAESIQILQHLGHAAIDRFHKIGTPAGIAGTERFLTQQGAA